MNKESNHKHLCVSCCPGSSVLISCSLCSQTLQRTLGMSKKALPAPVLAAGEGRGMCLAGLRAGAGSTLCPSCPGAAGRAHTKGSRARLPQCRGHSQDPSPCSEHSRAGGHHPCWGCGVCSAPQGSCAGFLLCDVAVPVINLHGKAGEAVNQLWAAPGPCEWAGQSWGCPGGDTGCTQVSVCARLSQGCCTSVSIPLHASCP